MNASPPINAIGNAGMSRITDSSDVPAMAATTSSSKPYGGVTRPIIRLTTTTTTAAAHRAARLSATSVTVPGGTRLAGAVHDQRY